jgi:hypothetical protein
MTLGFIALASPMEHNSCKTKTKESDCAYPVDKKRGQIYFRPIHLPALLTLYRPED